MRIRLINFISLALFASILWLNGCGEDSSPTAAAEEHFQAEGVLLVQDGQTVLKAFKGKVDSTVSQNLALTIGESARYEIKFLGSDGSVIEEPGHEHHEGESASEHEEHDHGFGYEISNTQVLRLTRGEGYDEWEFSLQGLMPGDTWLELQVMHLDHVDFRTPKIPVRVTAGAALAGGQ